MHCEELCTKCYHSLKKKGVGNVVHNSMEKAVLYWVTVKEWTTKHYNFGILYLLFSIWAPSQNHVFVWFLCWFVFVGGGFLLLLFSSSYSAKHYLHFWATYFDIFEAAQQEKCYQKDQEIITAGLESIAVCQATSPS